MSWIVENLWLIPALPVAAAGVIALLPRSAARTAQTLAIGAMTAALILSLLAFSTALDGVRRVVNFPWFDLGDGVFRLGWMLDPLTAVMLAMVTFVGLWIFIYSVGYLHDDPRRRSFFCYLSLFAGAMLALVIANHLLWLFMAWELVGVASYLLIGFWFQKPSAAAAARKAFITTRVGDIGLFLGMLWLSRETGPLLFFDEGNGCLEAGALAKLAAAAPVGGLAAATAIGLLLFCGAMGKSGQFPLHVWLPDAMEGPTPVSALIHAATMVAAGVFLIARVQPLMTPAALLVVTIVGVVTALFAALVALAQNDIKRILAYSTVSQLGFMMMALGVGGTAAAIFHLITHGFFKALLFLSAGSVIHGCGGEQDIRAMGGLRGKMKWTFAAYAVGMMALAGFPLLFSGFWSKEAILHAAYAWPFSALPFWLGLGAAVLTAFYMTRLTVTVFFGAHRSPAHPHEIPPVMTAPLLVLAAGSVLVGFVGTPVWPWFQHFLGGHIDSRGWSALAASENVQLMALSTLAVAFGVFGGWRLYGRTPRQSATDRDPLESLQPEIHHALANRLWIDEFYAATVIRGSNLMARAAAWMDHWLWDGLIRAAGTVSQVFAWLARIGDESVLNGGFDGTCDTLHAAGRRGSLTQNGRVPTYVRVIALGFCALLVVSVVVIFGGGVK